MAEPNIIVVDQYGDVVLHFQDHNAQVDQQFRCSRKVLGQKSRYFDVLFDPNKFSEGKEVEYRLDTLLKSYQDVVSIPSSSLPKVLLRDIGDIPATESHRVVAIFIFLKVLQGEPVEKLGYWANTMADWIPMKQKLKNRLQQALTCATILIILADQFDAAEVIRHYIFSSDELERLYLHNVKNVLGLKATEINHRRQLLVGMFLGHPTAVMQSSSALIRECSVHCPDDVTSGNNSPGYRLQHGLEGEKIPKKFAMFVHALIQITEELNCRREYAFETISSLLNHFIRLYSGKKQQCKLGYDTSPQCDSFQLGEMIRYLTRENLLRLQNTFDPDQDQPIYTDSVAKVIEKLRQCPSYQLDANHRHCGLRSRIIPLLDMVAAHGQVGICMRCWNHDQYKESWLTNPSRGTWSVSDRKSPLEGASLLSVDKQCILHFKVKAMYTAHERNWTTSVT